MNEKKEMKELLLYCIHIAKHKGVFYTQPEFDKAKEYVENMPNENEIDHIIRRERFTMNNATARKAKDVSKSIVTKLEKQKELLR